MTNHHDFVTDLSGYTLSDNEGKHKFTLPNGTTVKGNSQLYVYCTAKRGRGMPPPRSPFIYWQNKNGKIRPVMGVDGIIFNPLKTSSD